MSDTPQWEMIASVILVAGLVVFWLPGLKRSWSQSKNVTSDWGAVIIALLAVAAFVVLLIMSVN